MKKVKVVLRNPIIKKDMIDYDIELYDNSLSKDWVDALNKDILEKKLHLEKNYCFMGYPRGHRDLGYLTKELNKHIKVINLFNQTKIWQSNKLDSYFIEEWFDENTVMFSDPDYHIGDSEDDIGYRLKHDIMNKLHNHFERLQGTVWGLSEYYKLASPEVRYAIRQLNLLCHEIESLVLSMRKLKYIPEWVRPSQITTFINCPRHHLKDEHYDLFEYGYNKRFGEVYMHWCQIGKTLMEVFNDEGATDLNVGDDPTDISVGSGATCEAINSLKYYSGEFDIEWASDVVYNAKGQDWHTKKINKFYEWLENNKIDPYNKKLSLGYLPIARVTVKESFGTSEVHEVREIMENYLDIYSIETDNHKAIYDYNWNDDDYVKKQIELLNG